MRRLKTKLDNEKVTQQNRLNSARLALAHNAPERRLVKTLLKCASGSHWAPAWHQLHTCDHHTDPLPFPHPGTWASSMVT